MWRVQNSDGSPLQRRPSGRTRKGRSQCKEFYAADQREQGGALGSDMWLGVSEQGPSPRLFSLILYFAN